MLLRSPIRQPTDGQVPVIALINFVLNLCLWLAYHHLANVILNETSDNIFNLQQWCSTTFPQAKEQLEHMYREVGSPSPHIQLHGMMLPDFLSQ